ncbi:MAG: Serine/threonine-protein kinase pknK [Mycobacterium sp.]|nr:Serine/threonine-protein kinase pknK [Mycobacterium sp.]MDT5080568.1 serine/threonine-protein kinase PknK [Mycobacterium sp.]
MTVGTSVQSVPNDDRSRVVVAKRPRLTGFAAVSSSQVIEVIASASFGRRGVSGSKSLLAEFRSMVARRDLTAAIVAELGAAGFNDAEEIGRGGFGAVYRCDQRSLERTVAVKVLTTDLDADHLERFLREQRAMGRLSEHPNIVTVLAVGAMQSGRPYLVLPYYRRNSLNERIRRAGPLSWQESLHVGIKMAGALETAHRLGILHRDVKPANVLLTDYDEPQLADFGIARFRGGYETATGVVTGSPAFTAPEVLDGQAPSQASDVYSLGATLFCALTGHVAVERRNDEGLLAQFLRVTSESAPTVPGEHIPDDVRAAIEHAMSGAPGDRPTSAAELGVELIRAQHRHGLTVDQMPVPSADRGERADEQSPAPAPRVEPVARPVRVILAEDDVLLREGLASLLDRSGFDVVGQAGDGAELLTMVRGMHPELVVTDIRMPPTHTTEGLDAARVIRDELPDTGILVLSAHVEVEHAMELLASGRSVGYLLKSRITDVADFIDILQRIARGASVVDPALVAELVSARRRDDPLALLSERERQVLALMAEGKSNAGIAQRIWITEGTVEKHVRHILSKLNLPETGDDHRRVRAVITFLEAR